jgi:hypothetical protein
MGSTDWNKTTEDPIQRRRSPLSQFLQMVAARWCIVFSAPAIAGTLFCVVLSGLSLLLGMPLLADATVVITALAAGFYLPVFLSLHELTNPYASGYWLPRLILPALLVFFSLGFVMLDLGCKPWSGWDGPRIVVFGFSAALPWPSVCCSSASSLEASPARG